MIEDNLTLCSWIQNVILDVSENDIMTTIALYTKAQHIRKIRFVLTVILYPGSCHIPIALFKESSRSAVMTKSWPRDYQVHDGSILATVKIMNLVYEGLDRPNYSSGDERDGWARREGSRRQGSENMLGAR